jgi:hypothetical protein
MLEKYRERGVGARLGRGSLSPTRLRRFKKLSYFLVSIQILHELKTKQYKQIKNRCREHEMQQTII